MGSLGDVTRGLCLLAPIKKAFPESTVTWVIEPPWAELVITHPLVDEVIVFDRPNWWCGGLLDVRRQLRKGRFDCVLDLQRHFKSGLFSFFTRAPQRIGFSPKNAKEGNWLFNTAYIPERESNYPKIQSYLAFLNFLGVRPSEPLDFGFSEPLLQKNSTRLLSKIPGPFVAMVLGSSWPTKEWCYERYRELIAELLETTDLAVVLVDAPPKRALAETLSRSVDSPRLINLVGHTSVPELAAVLKEAAVAVGPDCGAGHIAAAVGTPYVSLFGPTDPARTAPYGNEHLVVRKDLPCAPCYKRRCARKDILCMQSISAGEVAAGILQEYRRTAI